MQSTSQTFYPTNSPMPPSNQQANIYYPSNPSNAPVTPLTGQPMTPQPMTPMSISAEPSGIVPQLQWAYIYIYYFSYNILCLSDRSWKGGEEVQWLEHQAQIP